MLHWLMLCSADDAVSDAEADDPSVNNQHKAARRCRVQKTFTADELPHLLRVCSLLCYF